MDATESCCCEFGELSERGRKSEREKAERVEEKKTKERKQKLTTSLQRGPVHLTDSQLLRYNGEDTSRPIYLALNGTIYDVTSNPRIYGPGGMYAVFSGRDAARGFVTGCFAVDNVPDLRGVEWGFIPRDVPTYEEKTDAELTELMRNYREDWIRDATQQVRDAVEHWQKVFRGETGKEYFEVGKVVGRKKETGPVRELCKPRPKDGLEKWMQKRRVEKAKAKKEGGDVKVGKDEL